MPSLLRQVEGYTKQPSRQMPMTGCWEVLQTQAQVQLMVQLIPEVVFLHTIIVRVVVLEAEATVVKMKRTNREVEEVLALETVTTIISINR